MKQAVISALEAGRLHGESGAFMCCADAPAPKKRMMVSTANGRTHRPRSWAATSTSEFSRAPESKLASIARIGSRDRRSPSGAMTAASNASVDVDETDRGPKFLIVTFGPPADVCQRPHER